MYFGLKNVYFFDLRQLPQVDAQAEVLQRLVDEAGMPALVARHVAHQRAHVLVLHVLLDFAVEHAARELGRARAHQEFDELLAQARRQLAYLARKLFVAFEMVPVVVAAELGHQLVPVRRTEDRSIRSSAA